MVVNEANINLSMHLYHEKIFFSSRRRHTRLQGDWSSDVCSSDLTTGRRKCALVVRRITETGQNLLPGTWLACPDQRLTCLNKACNELGGSIRIRRAGTTYAALRDRKSVV